MTISRARYSMHTSPWTAPRVAQMHTPQMCIPQMRALESAGNAAHPHSDHAIACQRRSWPARSRRAQSGQSLTELVIVLPVILLILLSAVDFGRLLAAGVSVSNAARQAAVYASKVYDPNYPGGGSAPFGCMLSNMQQLVSQEVIPTTMTPTVSVTTTTPLTPAYSGEQEMSVTVGYTFNLISPLWTVLRPAGKPIGISLADAEPVIPIPVTGTVSLPAPSLVTVTHGISSTGGYYDDIAWTTPLTTITQTFTISSPTVYTDSFVIYQSDPGVTTPAPYGCPIYTQQMTSTVLNSVNHYQVDNPTDASYTYWVATQAAHPPGYDGALGAATQGS